jgi:1-acyl-sn-glycerol-3-phosphate acyltransferase
VVVLAETRETDPGRREALRAAIATAGVAVLGAPPDDIVLASPHTVLKTSSGKIRRAACADLYQRGMLRAASVRVWPQLVRIALTGAATSLRRSIGRGGAWLFAAYAWTLFTLLALTALIAVTVLPRTAWRRHAATALARALVTASGVPIQIRGTEHFPQTGPITVVANHASYVDGILLLAVVPERCVFVAKKELAGSVVLRLLLGNLGTRFVERFDVEGSVEAARELAAQAGQGTSFVSFPEGTFAREPGLRPFHAGAFLAAANAGTGVIPLAIRGTRSLLRDGQWRPRLGPIQIIVMPALAPDGADWAAAIRLRDRARTAILAACGEPDLAVL